MILSSKPRQPLKTLLLSLILGVCLLLAWGGMASTAQATLFRTEEAPGQILSQSRHTLRDQTGEPWQVVFFKREKPQKTIIHLRLVGFPDVSSFDHPQPLKISTYTGKVWKAEDYFAEKNPADNVGEFDLTEIASDLPQASDLLLELSLTDETLSLKIPSEVVLEWHSILGSTLKIQ